MITFFQKRATASLLRASSTSCFRYTSNTLPSIRRSGLSTMKIAVEGCCHGQLDAIYDHIQALESKNNYKVDLLLICGDFQAIRNLADLQCMAVPNKYKTLGGFYKYYTGEKTAPILTVVIGGNHEASNYLWELYHGGWLAPNIYFLGHAGCIQVNGVRIAGASGIFKQYDFRRGNYEVLPYTPNWLRSIYHIREFNVRRLSLLSQPTIFMSHDWPRSIERHGNLKKLLSHKSFLLPDIKSGNLGSPPMMGLLRTLKPTWWFSAHLHVRYEATVTHGPQLGQTEGSEVVKVENPDEIVIDADALDIAAEPAAPKSDSLAAASSAKQNPDAITLDDEEIVVEAPAAPVSVTGRRSELPTQGSSTRFLALDKCLPRRQFLEVVDIPTTASMSTSNVQPVLEFDPEWLAITRAFNEFFSTQYPQFPFPEEDEARKAVSDALQWVVENLQNNNPSQALPISDVETFVQTAPPPKSPSSNQKVKESEFQPPAYSNPQTEAFCRMLGITNKINPGASNGHAEEKIA